MRLVACLIFGFLSMTPTFADVALANSEGLQLKDTIANAWNTFENLGEDAATSARDALEGLIAIQTKENTTNPLEAVLGAGYNQPSNFTFDFVTHVFDIRQQLMSMPISHMSETQPVMTGLLALALAFVLCMIFFSVSSLISIFQLFFGKLRPGVSYGQQFMGLLYMVPYSGYYTMMALTLAVVVAAFLLVGKEVARILSDTEIVAKMTKLGQAISALITGVSGVFHAYVTESMPTPQQIQALSFELSRAANATYSLAVAIEKGDAALQTMNSTVPQL